VDSKRNARPGGAGGPGPSRPQGPPSTPAARRPGSPAAGPAAGGGGARRPGPQIGEMLDQLGRDIRQLQVDFERFFNGALPFPPEELRNRVQGQLRQFRSLNLTAAVDNFRLADLEARYNTYNELWNRRVRDQEEGRHAAARPATPEAPRYDVERGILVAGSIDPAAAMALYQALARSEAPKFDLDSFRTYLERQAVAIRTRTGCDQVQFRLADEDGKLKLKARPVGESTG
jgi:hypothetical protein